MRIEHEGIVLRPWRREEAARLAELANDRAIWRNLRDRFPHPYAVADAEVFLSAVAEQPCVFAIEVGGEPVGGAGLQWLADVNRRTAEVGYWLGRAYWGRGIATRAVRALVGAARSQPDLLRLEARVFASNAASLRVLQKAGFDQEARLRARVFKDGVVEDEIVLGRLL
jgi:RimJ/RimL family protein N-acetyltransferase